MNQPALPTYLQNRQTRKISEDAAAGLGSSLPAHISTEGSVFTLIDAAGNAQRLTFQAQDGKTYQQPFLDACVVDLNAGLSKRYYGGKKYVKDSGDAPVCWSANGVAPSNESQQKQARTCAECKLNERGSAVSEISGAAIKACRDEKWLALNVPQTGLDTLFRFVLTPGSFKNWKAYTEAFKGGAVDLSDVVTRFEWVGPDAPNVIKFSATSYIDERTAQLAERALAAKATDALVGRDDAPRQIAAAPLQQALPSAQPEAAEAPEASFVPAPPPPPQGGFPSAQVQSLQTTAAESPAPGRRRRNTAQPTPVQQNLPLQAPFPVGAPPSNGASPTFGIKPGVAPDPALAATLAQIFPR